MKDITNKHFLEWLRPVKSKRRFELLNDIGLSQEKKGVPDKAIKEHYSQIQDQVYVVLENLTDDEILAQTRLYAGSKIGSLEKELSESNNEESIDRVRDSYSVLEQQFPYSIQSLEEDDDSIEIALSEDSDTFETIYTEPQENESNHKLTIQKDNENRQTNNFQILQGNNNFKDFSNLKEHGFDCKNSKLINNKTADAPSSYLKNSSQSDIKNDKSTDKNVNSNAVESEKIENVSDQSGWEESGSVRSCEKDARKNKTNDTFQVENISSNCIAKNDVDMMSKETSAAEEGGKKVEDQANIDAFQNKQALVDQTKSFKKNELTKLQEKLGEKFKSKNLDIDRLGHKPECEGKDVKDRHCNDSFKNNPALDDQTKSLQKNELTKLQEKLGEKLKSKNLDIDRLGHKPECDGKDVKDREYNVSFNNNPALVDQTKSLQKNELTKLQEKLGVKLKSKILDLDGLGHKPEYEEKDVKDRHYYDSFKNNPALVDQTKSLQKNELTKLQEKLEEKLKIKKSEIYKLGHKSEHEIKIGLTTNVTNDKNSKQEPLIFVSKNLLKSPNTGKEILEGEKVLEDILKKNKFCEKTINDKGSEGNKQSKELMQPILIGDIEGNDAVENSYITGNKKILENSVKGLLSKENVIINQGTTVNKDVPEFEEGNTTLGFENMETVCDEPEIDLNQWRQTEFKVFCTSWPVAEASQGKNVECSSMISDNDITSRQHKNKNSSEIQEHNKQFSFQVKRLEKQLSAKKQKDEQLRESEPKKSTVEKRRLSEQPYNINNESNDPKKRRMSEQSSAKHLSSKEQKRYLHDLSAVVNYPVPQAKTCTVAPSTTSTAAAVDSLLSDNTVSSSTSSAYLEKHCKECSPHIVGTIIAQKNETSLEKSQSLHTEQPLPNLHTCVSLDVQRNQHVPPKESASAKSIAERAVIHKAITMFLYYFQNPENIHDCIPFEFRSRLVQYVQAKGVPMINTSNSKFVSVYLSMYIDMVDDFVNVKINKCAEILHLAIADWNRKIERKNRALKLTSEILRNEEIKRAEADYNEMLLLRGNKFKEIFELLMSRFTFCEYPMLATLYYRITLALVSIDQENINHVYRIGVLIVNLLKNCGFKFTSSCTAWFTQTNECLVNSYHFVKHSLVALYFAGYSQKGAEDVLKFYHLRPCTSELKQMILFGSVEQETAAVAEKRSQGIEPVQGEISSVEPPKKQLSAFGSLQHQAIQQPSRQASFEPNPLSTPLRNSSTTRNPPQYGQEQRRVKTVAQNPVTLTQQQNQIQVVLQSIQQSAQQSRMQTRPIQQQALQSPQHQKVLQTVYSHINQRQHESNSRGNYKSQNFETSQNPTLSQPSATIRPSPSSYQNHVGAQMAQNLQWQNQIMQQTQHGSNASWNGVQSSQHQFAATNQSSSTILSNTPPDRPRVVPQSPTFTSQRAESTSTTPTDSPEDMARSVCNYRRCSRLSTIVCSICKTATYCSRNCQTLDWYNSHSIICLGFNQPSTAGTSHHKT